MTFIEKLLAFKARPPFDRLNDAELALLASIAHERTYAPGEQLLTRGSVLKRLYVVARGEVVGSAGLLGLFSLLFDEPIADDQIAGAAAGATCLIVGRSNFLTLVYEHPQLLTGFLESPDFALYR